MSEIELMIGSGVGVWSYPDQNFVSFVPCPGEKRVRIDVFDDLDNYDVYAGYYESTGDGVAFVVFGETDETGEYAKPLEDWQIDYT